MYVPGKVCGTPVEFLVDSGANISLISSEVYKSIPIKLRPSLRRWPSDTSTADGTPLTVHGFAEFPITVGDSLTIYNHILCVAMISTAAILGYDFLRQNNAILDVGKGGISLSEDTADMAEGWSEKVPSGLCEIAVSRTIEIPAGSEAITEGHVIGDSDEFIGIIEPAERFRNKSCLLIARAEGGAFKGF